MPAMRISEIYRQQRRVFSFEFFPPKTDEGFRALYRTIEKLKNRGPGFVSVTWGAGGSTRRKTVDLVIEIQHKLGITAMAHLSCVDSTREQFEKTLDKLEEDVLEVKTASRRGTRRAVVRFGEPIVVSGYDDLRAAAASLTDAIQSRVQGMLDEFHSNTCV